MQAGQLTQENRNILLSEMTDEVAQLVLRENYLQTRSINLSVSQGVRASELNMRERIPGFASELNILEKKPGSSSCEFDIYT
jgi:NAD-specific glutamate dehydrogenase